MSYKLDLHTHSIASADGGITAKQYKNKLHDGQLDYIAVTDHNKIDFAVNLQNELGDRIIVGEEIMTSAGEIIGLFLSKVIPAGLTPADTIKLIKQQDGLVYVPHPFETIRKGLSPNTLDKLVEQIDLIEVCNGRALLQNRGKNAVLWAKINHVTGVASSDAHGAHGLGKTYTCVAKQPTKKNLLNLLETATLITGKPRLRALLYPKYNKVRKKIRRQA